MSTFAPTSWTTEPGNPPDALSTAVVQSLNRPISGGLVWRPFKSFVWGALTFGILPLLIWQKKFARMIVAERQQMSYLLQWVAARYNDPDASQMSSEIDALPAPREAILISTLILIFMAIGLFPVLVHENALRIIWAGTFGQPALMRSIFWHVNWRGSYPASPARLFALWNISLALCYAFHWIHVRTHGQEMNRLLVQINALLSRHAIPPILIPRIPLGIRFRWLIAGAIGYYFGAIWAIPAAFAGGIHQTYIRRTSDAYRVQLAQRIFALLQTQNPPVDVKSISRTRGECQNHLCSQPLPTDANYCPRCGTRRRDNV